MPVLLLVDTSANLCNPLILHVPAKLFETGDERLAHVVVGQLIKLPLRY